MDDEAHTDRSASDQEGDVAPIGLRWGLKASFLDYIVRMPDGRISAEAGAAWLGRELFFGFDADRSQPGRLLAFRGQVRFTGHFGFLSVRLTDPVVHLDSDRSRLTVAGPVDSGERIDIVSFRIERKAILDDRAAYRGIDVQLHPAAVELFNDVYRPGERFEDLTLVLPTVAHA
jgi:hypothetical protein